MFHSIRWRLVASFTLLTLLTVTLLGVMVLILMQRSLEQQAAAYLNANAEAVAKGSQALFRPMPQTAELSQLAYTAAFLGDFHVRILDDQKQVLVDAGSPASREDLTWVMRRPAAPAPGEPIASIVAFDPAPGREGLLQAENFPAEAVASEPAIGEAIPPAAIFTMRRLSSPWGQQLYFHTPEHGMLVAASRPLTAPTGGWWGATNSALIEPVDAAFQATAPIQAGSNVVGYVEMRSATNYVTATLATIQRAFLAAAALVMVVSVAVGLIVSRGLTAPLEGLASATSKMNSGDLSARAPVHGHDEIGVLARQFNQMATALEQTFAALAAERDALRRFIADASHELRTPITALRTFHELLLGSAGHDPTAQREFLLEGQGQIDRLERITANLLNLSRLDGGLVQLALAEEDLCQLAATVAGSFKALAQERQIDLRIQLPPESILSQVDRTQLETALSNLIDNALKFTPSGGQVQIGIEAASESIRLWVKDNGPGIAGEELPRIFDRFHRGQDANVAGSGLGLAIVQGIVQAHGGQVAVTSQLGVGARFTIVLPQPKT